MPQPHAGTRRSAVLRGAFPPRVSCTHRCPRPERARRASAVSVRGPGPDSGVRSRPRRAEMVRGRRDARLVVCAIGPSCALSVGRPLWGAMPWPPSMMSTTTASSIPRCSGCRRTGTGPGTMRMRLWDPRDSDSSAVSVGDASLVAVLPRRFGSTDHCPRCPLGARRMLVGGRAGRTLGSIGVLATRDTVTGPCLPTATCAQKRITAGGPEN